MEKEKQNELGNFSKLHELNRVNYQNNKDMIDIIRGDSFLDYERKSLLIKKIKKLMHIMDYYVVDLENSYRGIWSEYE